MGDRHPAKTTLPVEMPPPGPPPPPAGKLVGELGEEAAVTLVLAMMLPRTPMVPAAWDPNATAAAVPPRPARPPLARTLTPVPTTELSPPSVPGLPLVLLVVWAAPPVAPGPPPRTRMAAHV